MATETSPAAAAPPRARGPRIAIALGIVVGVIAIYVLSLIAVHLLAKSGPRLPAIDMSQFQKEDTVVQLRVEELKTVANRLSVDVLVSPKESLIDQDSRVLTTDTAVRLYPETDLGDQLYPKGKAVAQVATTIVAHGDPGNWPFDTYTTDEISGLVFTGGYRDKVWARMEATGSIDGWDVNVTRVHDAEDTENPSSLDDVIITLHRSKGTLIFDLGICLILIALPVLALWVAIPVALLLAVGSQTIVTFLVGESFSEAWLPMVIALFGVLPAILLFWGRAAMLAFGDAMVATKIIGTSLVVQFALLLVLVRPLGATGAALGFAGLFLVSAIMTFSYLRRRELI